MVNHGTKYLDEARSFFQRSGLFIYCEFPRAIQMMSRGLLHPDLLITDVQPLGNIEKVFQGVDRENPETLKVILDIKDV